jgi:hypothetical protein
LRIHAIRSRRSIASAASSAAKFALRRSPSARHAEARLRCSAPESRIARNRDAEKCLVGGLKIAV